MKVLATSRGVTISRVIFWRLVDWMRWILHTFAAWAGFDLWIERDGAWRTRFFDLSREKLPCGTHDIYAFGIHLIICKVNPRFSLTSLMHSAVENLHGLTWRMGFDLLIEIDSAWRTRFFDISYKRLTGTMHEFYGFGFHCIFTRRTKIQHVNPYF